MAHRGDHPVEVLTKKQTRSRPFSPAAGDRAYDLPELIVHRARKLERDDWIRRQGIKVTTVERTLLDCASTEPSMAVRRMVAQALVKKRTTIARLLDAIDRHPGHRGIKALRTIIATTAPTRSDAEIITVDLLNAERLGPFRANDFVEGVGELDIHFHEHGYAIEFDSRELHDNPISRADDRAKTERARARGIQIDRLRWRDITRARAGPPCASGRSSPTALSAGAALARLRGRAGWRRRACGRSSSRGCARSRRRR